MAREKKGTTGLPKKTYWHVYSLQNVPVEGGKLANLIQGVIKGTRVLIK